MIRLMSIISGIGIWIFISGKCAEHLKDDDWVIRLYCKLWIGIHILIAVGVVIWAWI